jgi:hypothetical protein
VREGAGSARTGAIRIRREGAGSARTGAIRIRREGAGSARSGAIRFKLPLHAIFMPAPPIFTGP